MNTKDLHSPSAPLVLPAKHPMMATHLLHIWRMAATVLLIANALSGTSSGQVMGDGYNNSLIYKIESGNNTVYLLGSIHVLAEEYYPLTRAFSYAYYDSQKVIFEVDPEILFSPGIQYKFEKAYSLPEGKTLKDLLSSDTVTLLTKKLTRMGIGLDQVNTLKPWVVTRIVGSTVFSTKDFRRDLGIENHFFRMAKDAGKPTGGLETLEDQLKIEDQMPLKMQETFLREALTIATARETEKAFLHLVKSWHRGDMKALENIIEGQKKKNPRYHRELLTNRNKRWIPQFESFLQENQNVLVIVGAAHLLGNDGLLRLLSEKGHTPERMSFARP